jgi:sugar/nucleoside kinase (ribokinase family)
VQATLDPIEPVSSGGSGDAFLAGYVAARYSGRPPDDCLRFAVACGAESTQHLGAGVIDVREVERLAEDVDLRTVQESPIGAGSQ